MKSSTSADDCKPLAIGRRLLVGERQAAERLGQRLGCSALRLAAGAGDQIIRADLASATSGSRPARRRRARRARSR